MPRLPDKFDLGNRPTPSAVTRSVATADVSAPFRAMSQLGETVAKIGIKEGEKVNDLDYMKGKAYYNSKNIPALDTFENDPDYSTYKTRYIEQATQFKDEALQSVRNPRMREKLALELDNDIVANVSRLDKLSTAKLRDIKRVQFDEASTNNKNAYNAAKTPEERERVRLDQARLSTSLAETGEDRSYIYKKMKEWEASANLNQAMIDAQTDLVGVNKALEARVTGSGATSGVPLSVRNNNPGNLRPVGGDGFRSFATPEEGIQAMKDDLTAKITGKSPAMKAKYGKDYKPTLKNLINVYAPTSENDTQAYINKVVKDTGIAADKELSTSDLDKIIPSMIEQEGGKKAKEYFVDGKRDGVGDYSKYSYVNGLDTDDALRLYTKTKKEVEKQEKSTGYFSIQSGIDNMKKLASGEMLYSEFLQDPNIPEADKIIAKATEVGDEESFAAAEKLFEDVKLPIGKKVFGWDVYDFTTESARLKEQFNLFQKEGKEGDMWATFGELDKLRNMAGLARAFNNKAGNAKGGLSPTHYDTVLAEIKVASDMMYEGLDSQTDVGFLWGKDNVYEKTFDYINDKTKEGRYRSELLKRAIWFAGENDIDLHSKDVDITELIKDLDTYYRSNLLKIRSGKAAGADNTVDEQGNKATLGTPDPNVKEDVAIKAKPNYEQLLKSKGATQEEIDLLKTKYPDKFKE